jgi:hypothetical protein
MSEAIYCFDTAAVKFAIYPEGGTGPRIIAEIGEDPLAPSLRCDRGR